MAGDQRRSVVVLCVEVASVAISGKEELKQAEQWEVGYIFPAIELLSFLQSWMSSSSAKQQHCHLARRPGEISACQIHCSGDPKRIEEERWDSAKSGRKGSVITGNIHEVLRVVTLATSKRYLIKAAMKIDLWRHLHVNRIKLHFHLIFMTKT